MTIVGKLPIAMLLMAILSGCAPINMLNEKETNRNYVAFVAKVFDPGWTRPLNMPYFKQNPRYDYISQNYQMVWGGYTAGSFFNGSIRGTSAYWWAPISMQIEEGDMFEGYLTGEDILAETFTDLTKAQLVHRIICRKSDTKYEKCVEENRKYLGVSSGEPSPFDNEVRRATKQAQ